MKIKRKGLITAVVALLMIAVIVPVYAQSQSGIMQQDRDQDCTLQGPATRAYGEEPPVQAQEEKPEGISEEDINEVETPIQEQTQTQEQLKDRDCENLDCEQPQYQHQEQYQYQHGQEEQD
jgi:hypothetical protein